MSQHDDRNDVPDGESVLPWIDGIADRFDAAWQAALHGAPPPRIEDFVAQADEPKRSVLLRELIQFDVKYRHGRGETPTRTTTSVDSRRSIARGWSR